MLAHKSSAGAQRAVCRNPARAVVRTAPLRPARAVAVEVLEEVEVEIEETRFIDVVALNKRLEARAKALIALEEQEIRTRPVVKIRVQKQVGLGDAWKICGLLPEFGRFRPEAAPFLRWNNGHVWTYEGRVRPGTWKYKLVLRRADGAYVWEEGEDRVLKVPRSAGPDDVVDVVLHDVKLPA